MWENIDETRPDSAHYSIMRRQRHVSGMDALRGMFPDAKADTLNFCLFSTSGVHGTYTTIEEAEKVVNGTAGEYDIAEVTFLVVHPRLVALRYGTCDPETLDDIEFLKALRASSLQAVAGIGVGEEDDWCRHHATTRGWGEGATTDEQTYKFGCRERIRICDEHVNELALKVDRLKARCRDARELIGDWTNASMPAHEWQRRVNKWLKGADDEV